MADFTVLAEVTKVSNISSIDWNMWMALATALAAAFTGWNAWETRKTVRISNEALALSKRPYLCFDGELEVKFSNSFMKAQIFVPIKNVGQVQLYYIVKRMLINNIIQNTEDFSRIGLMPGNTVKTFTSIFPLPHETTSENYNIDLRIEYEYWLSDSEKKYPLQRTFEIRPDQNDGRKSWITYKDDYME